MNLDALLDSLLALLGLVYGHRWVVPFVLVVLMWAWAVFVYIQARLRTRPFLLAADARIAVLKAALGADRDVVSERQAFSAAFPDVQRAMESGGERTQSLVQAWREFEEQIIDERASPIRNTSRPDPFFRRAGPKQTAVTFWSNAFIGIGLILTFLGLIYALSVAAKGMETSGSDVAQAQASLIALLTAAGAKFFASVGGLFASLGLRFCEHNLTKSVVTRTDAICSLLERGLLYVPAQKIAAEQLDVLREQRDELKTFNTDLALQIGERVGAQFHQAMAPVAESLSTLNVGMASMSEGLREGLGRGAADAVSAAASGELRALGQTLNQLREQLQTLGGHVGSSGEDASRQIRAAGADFREAAENIRAAFDQLAGQVEGLGARMGEQGEAAARAQSDALGRVLSGLEDAQGRSTAAVDDLAARMTERSEAAGRAQSDALGRILSGIDHARERSVATAEEINARVIRDGEASSKTQSDALARVLEQLESAQGRSASAMTQAVDALQGAGLAAANDLQAGLTGALQRGVQESQAVFRHAVEESGEGLRSAVGDLSRAVGEAANDVARAGGAFEKSGEGAGRAAEAMTGVADRARQASNDLNDASRGFSAAATPVSQSSLAVSAAADRLAKAVETGRDANAEALRGLNALSEGLKQTHAAAETAWRDYRARFEGVDKSLETVTLKLSETLGDSIGQFREFAQKVDGELGAAVSKLSGSLTAIENYAGALEDYVESARPAAPEAGE